MDISGPQRMPAIDLADFLTFSLEPSLGRNFPPERVLKPVLKRINLDLNNLIALCLAPPSGQT